MCLNRKTTKNASGISIEHFKCITNCVNVNICKLFNGFFNYYNFLFSLILQIVSRYINNNFINTVKLYKTLNISWLCSTNCFHGVFYMIK